MTLSPVDLGRNFIDVVEVEASLPLTDGSIDNLIESTEAGDVVAIAEAGQHP